MHAYNLFFTGTDSTPVDQKADSLSALDALRLSFTICHF